MFLLRLIEGRCVIFLSRRSRDYLKFTLRKRSYLLRQPTAAATPHRQSTMSTTMGRRFASVSNTFTVFQLPGQCSKGGNTFHKFSFKHPAAGAGFSTTFSAPAPPTAVPPPSQTVARVPSAVVTIEAAGSCPNRRRKRSAPEATFPVENDENIDPRTGRPPPALRNRSLMPSEQQQQQHRQSIMSMSARPSSPDFKGGGGGGTLPPRRRYTPTRMRGGKPSACGISGTAAAAAAAGASRQPLRTLWKRDEKSCEEVLAGRPPTTEHCLTVLRAMR